MELDAIGLMLAMFESHDLFFGRDGGHFQLSRDWIIDHQRVITHRFKGRRNTFENTLPVVSHFGSLAVHETLGAVHFAAEDCTETLVSEADSEYGNLAIEVFDCICRNAIIFDGFAGARGDDEVARVQ